MTTGPHRPLSRARGRKALAHTFRSLKIRNYRLFVSGQIVSVTGLGIQQVGLAWLVVERTGSGVALGTTVALQFLPILLFGMWGGLLADRRDKRRLLLATQVAASAFSLALWALVAGGAVELWMVYALAFGTGCVHAIDMPARQAFAVEMVGPAEVPNAVALNSAVFNAGRLVGAALAGLMIVSTGIASCFLANALTYVASFAALARMDPDLLVHQQRAVRARGQVRDGLRHVWHTPALRSPLMLVAVVGTLGFNFGVILPLFAREDLGGGARLFGLLTSLMGLGSLVGALLAAARARPTPRVLVGAAGAFGVVTAATAAAPNAAVAAPLLVATGLCVMVFLTTANATVQLAAAPDMRGRVMSLYALVFLGSTPVGGPLMGAAAERFGSRSALVLAGLACVVAAAAAARGPLFTNRPELVADPDDDASLLGPFGGATEDPIEAA